MAITSSDIKYRLATTAGSAGNSLSQGDPNASLGKYISTTDVANATLHALFDVVTGDENAASDVEYRCLFIYNSHGTLTLEGPKVWLSAETSGGCNAAIGIDTTAASAVGNGSAQALTIANEGTAPAGVSFSSPTSKGAGLSLGDLAAGQVRAVWVRRTATDSAALNNDGVSVAVEGDTGA